MLLSKGTVMQEIIIPIIGNGMSYHNKINILHTYRKTKKQLYFLKKHRKEGI